MFRLVDGLKNSSSKFAIARGVDSKVPRRNSPGKYLAAGVLGFTGALLSWASRVSCFVFSRFMFTSVFSRLVAVSGRPVSCIPVYLRSFLHWYLFRVDFFLFKTLSLKAEKEFNQIATVMGRAEHEHTGTKHRERWYFLAGKCLSYLWHKFSVRRVAEAAKEILVGYYYANYGVVRMREEELEISLKVCLYIQCYIHTNHFKYLTILFIQLKMNKFTVETSLRIKKRFVFAGY